MSSSTSVHTREVVEGVPSTVSRVRSGEKVIDEMKKSS